MICNICDETLEMRHGLNTSVMLGMSAVCKVAWLLTLHLPIRLSTQPDPTRSNAS